MKLIGSLILTGFLFSTHAFSGLHLEPYIGAGKNVTDISFAQAALSDQDDDVSTSHVGARVGYSFLLLSAGIDYEMASSSDVSANNLAVFVGVDMPILLRAYGKYYLSSNIDNDNVDVDFEFKDGYALGVGFTGLPFVSINVEVQSINYEFDGSGGAVTGDASSNVTLLSVSLPI